MTDAAPLDVEAIEAERLRRAGARVLDVRDDVERLSGVIPDSIAIPLAQLAARHRELGADDGPLLAVCASGRRSLQAARLLRELGHADVRSIAGGLARWRELDLPVSALSGVDADFGERYLRHLLLSEIGLDGQRRLEASRIALIGAGGLGAPASLYLAAAGVGMLRLVDDDRVDRSNLQRQIVHAESRIGQPKVDSAAATLSALNPRTRIERIAQRLTSANVDDVLRDVDVVIDGADNFPARYLLSDACVKLGKPLVYGAVYRFDGQASVFDAGRRRGASPCYRCLFPEPPPPDAAPNCAQAGVLGVLPGLVGLIQATEAIKLILSLGTSLDGRLLHIDALSMRFRQTRLKPDPQCAVCAPGLDFPGYVDYDAFCAAG